jgi:hypothetical protein
VQIDVHNSHVASGNEITSCGFEVFDETNLLNSVFVELYAVNKNNGKGFYSVLRNNDRYAAEGVTGDLNAIFGTVKIAYDPTTRVLQSYYDADGAANGSTWILLASFGIAGAGGTTGNANWGIAPSTGFKLQIYGYSEDVTITSGMLYLDNFSVVPEPAALIPVSLLLGLTILSSRRHRR